MSHQSHTLFISRTFREQISNITEKNWSERKEFVLPFCSSNGTCTLFTFQKTVRLTLFRNRNTGQGLKPGTPNDNVDNATDGLVYGAKSRRGRTWVVFVRTYNNIPRRTHHSHRRAPISRLLPFDFYTFFLLGGVVPFLVPAQSPPSSYSFLNRYAST